jgi:Tfp pilus assembly protein FimT
MATARRRRAERGISLPELMVVIALLALGVIVTVPLIADRVHDIKMQSAVSEFTVALRAARMAAVARGATVTVTVSASDGSYGFADAAGTARTYLLPAGARFDPSSTAAIPFRPDGSLDAAATAILEARFSDGTVRSWTVHVPLSGFPAVTHDDA